MKGPEPKCPECGEELTRDEVDIGVGTMYGPPRCNYCGWFLDIEENIFKEKPMIGGGMTDYEKMIKIHHPELWEEWNQPEEEEERGDENDE